MFKTENGDRVVYEFRDGKMQKVSEPAHPERTNFVIVCAYGDWSGFRTLAECEKQFPTMEASHRRHGRGDGWYAVVER
jgi:hypothetical protein